MEERVNWTLNGVQVSALNGSTILQAARENNVTIPTLCYLEDLPPVGACRLCVVEVEGSRALVGSCHTPVTAGMVVQTHSPRVIETRRVIVELLLASHPESCLVCDKANLCELRRIAADLDIGLPRYRVRKHYFPIEDGNPRLVRDLSKCILCRRCVSVCRNQAGKRQFSIGYRGFESKVICRLDQTVDDALCQDCDACVSVCPTGALSRPVRLGRPRQALVIKG
ncbi:MAG: (2Fe-2S)-binding protein [Chloroflexi bacterium]|nr:(2Fe-2S)-binding protein [Chloroflexota bacterium]